MFQIVKREQYGPLTFLWEVHAPHVAKACRPGHFLMVRIDETGERIPLTVADFDADKGTVTIVVQAVGKTTFQMMDMKEGESILDFIGPLGVASDLRQCKKPCSLAAVLACLPEKPQNRGFFDYL